MMKRLALFAAVFATLFGSAAYAQNTGRGAAAARNSGSDDFSWGIGLAGVAVLGVVVGLTAAAAADSPSTFSH